MGTIHGGIRRVTTIGRRIVALAAIALLTFTTASCAKPTQPTELISEPTPQPNRLIGQIAEVSPPAALETLKQIIDAYTPQVRLLSPRPGEVLNDTTVTVRLQVRGLPLFKNDNWQLGPHLHLFLDNEPYQAVYDSSEPITFENLAPGTHTLRVFASRPWHESFKNQGAFDQRTFHVVAPTPQNELDANAPLLTYSRPQSTYGAEPIMLDFYLTNAPLHMSAQAEANDDLRDWRIRCTVNDQSFVFDQWQPIWLKGFKPGRNWVQLELIDEAGNPIDNRFNNTVRIIDYQPGGTDTLSQLVRGELDVKDIAGIIDPTYLPPAPDEDENAEPEEATAPDEAPVQKSIEPEAAQPAPGETPPEEPLEKNQAKSTEPVPPNPDSPGPDVKSSLPSADSHDAVQPNPFLRPELPPELEPPESNPEPEIVSPVPVAPEDSGGATPADDPADNSSDALDEPAKSKESDETPSAPTADDSAQNQADGSAPLPRAAAESAEPSTETPLTAPKTQQPPPGDESESQAPVEVPPTELPPDAPRSPIASEARPFI